MSTKTKLIKSFALASAVTLAGIKYYQDNYTIDNVSYVVDGDNDKRKRLNICQISDLHNVVYGKGHSGLISKLEGKKVDMFAITGDFVDRFSKGYSKAFALAKILVDLAPVYYVSGNHERTLDKNDYRIFVQNLKSIGVHVLENEIADFNEKVQIIGLDADNLSRNDGTLKRLMDKTDDDKVHILLAHEPQEFEWYASCKPDVVLCGHAHGGQIRIPFTDTRVYAPEQGFFPMYTNGLYKIGNTKMIVSTGLGNSHFPMRALNRPQLVFVQVRY